MKPALQKPPGYRDPAAPQPPPSQPKPPPSMRKPYVPPSFHPNRKRRSFCRCCCCFFCISFLIIVILLVVGSAIFYIWFDPKLPKFHLQSLQTPKFNVAVKPDGTFLDAHTVVRVEATNPNHKLWFEYGATEARVSAEEDVELGSGHAPGFVQGKRNTTVFKIETDVKGAQIEDGVGRRLKDRFRTKELVLVVEVRTRFGIGADRFRLGMVPVRVRCGDVSLKKLDGENYVKVRIELLQLVKDQPTLTMNSNQGGRKQISEL
ncbi:hypothetical protein Sjap_021065 [Stephania japonica]|uniref:Late embryogenesis abundant protein LEA-2 subgroup domain-containing protein n=1 Tax=Stephania japonica TaxID=461633 RepID=A0AAP0F335_9MAGN